MQTAIPIVVGAAAALGSIRYLVLWLEARRLRARLDFAATRTAQLVRRNRELSDQRQALQDRHDAYRAVRSAAVAKGNRTRSAKRTAGVTDQIPGDR